MRTSSPTTSKWTDLLELAGQLGGGALEPVGRDLERYEAHVHETVVRPAGEQARAASASRASGEPEAFGRQAGVRGGRSIVISSRTSSMMASRRSALHAERRRSTPAGTTFSGGASAGTSVKLSTSSSAAIFARERPRARARRRASPGGGRRTGRCGARPSAGSMRDERARASPGGPGRPRRARRGTPVRGARSSATLTHPAGVAARAAPAGRALPPGSAAGVARVPRPTVPRSSSRSRVLKRTRARGRPPAVWTRRGRPCDRDRPARRTGRGASRSAASSGPGVRAPSAIRRRAPASSSPKIPSTPPSP